MVLARMPLPASCSASPWMYPTMAVFAVPYGPEAKSDSRPDTLEMAMIDAASLRSR